MTQEWFANYIGLPYKRGGRERSGIDCWGLITLVWWEQLKFLAPSFETVQWDNATADTRRESIDRIVSAINSDIGRYQSVAWGEQRPLDGVLLRMRGAPMHCGVMIDPFRMLHIEEGTDSCIEDLRRIHWRGRVLSYYRPPGITHA